MASSNVGAMIARALSVELGIPAFIYDGITVDELTPINKLTGLPILRRKGMGHNLNTRAAAMRYARESGRNYKDITVIVAHLGGGIAYSKYVTEYIRERVEFIAPVVVYPGEDEMLSLALGGLRVLRGEEKAKIYHKVENPGY